MSLSIKGDDGEWRRLDRWDTGERSDDLIARIDDESKRLAALKPGDHLTVNGQDMVCVGWTERGLTFKPAPAS